MPSSLSVDHAHGASPALTVAQTLTEEFVDAGIEVAAGAREGKADTDGLVSIGSIASPPMMDMLIHAGHDSDNKVIESLATIAAQRSAGDEGADEGVAELITQHARSHGAEVAVANASGLGRSNFAAPAEITNYLATVAKSDFLTYFVRTLPRAGQEGTLRDRMRNTAAVHRVRAKTGTLTQSRKPILDALAGYVFGQRRSVAFSIVFEEPVARYASKSSIDRIAVSLAEYCA
ncbi:D-alanyl-D-alanine carboxypeptidase [Brevibacterium aurantiacum]|uniref:D-alanyl-D-alanine carboxypeptidase, serine-type, PBP4 family n=1 Tax=Brevibacterium aurantiacum TaxID=273384 RepID=A0A2H1J2G0_BREAU|nr:D-alanyl-D-alanine carboxypeptidase [Brevibacterium aurantiacum]SMX81568.1 D-alanyl-D-alanine carboxypeptidase, serine-type, PBP4 family [Brevibacterium aurantiacum]